MLGGKHGKTYRKPTVREFNDAASWQVKYSCSTFHWVLNIACQLQLLLNLMASQLWKWRDDDGVIPNVGSCQNQSLIAGCRKTKVWAGDLDVKLRLRVKVKVKVKVNVVVFHIQVKQQQPFFLASYLGTCQKLSKSVSAWSCDRHSWWSRVQPFPQPYPDGSLGSRNVQVWWIERST